MPPQSYSMEALQCLQIEVILAFEHHLNQHAPLIIILQLPYTNVIKFDYFLFGTYGGCSRSISVFTTICPAHSCRICCYFYTLLLQKSKNILLSFYFVFPRIVITNIVRKELIECRLIISFKYCRK